MNPFRTLGSTAYGLEAILSDRRMDASRPVVLVVHVAHPRIQYADRGKSAVLSEAIR